MSSDPESYCHRCKGPNVVWYAPSPLWNAVMRQGDDLLWNEIICPTCFAVLAEQAGVADGWRLDARALLTELQTVSPDGRVWDSATDLWRDPPTKGRREQPLDMRCIDALCDLGKDHSGDHWDADDGERWTNFFVAGVPGRQQSEGDPEMTISPDDCEDFGGHCYEDDRSQVHPAIEPPEGGWPVAQTCKHCGARRTRRVVFEVRA